MQEVKTPLQLEGLVVGGELETCRPDFLLAGLGVMTEDLDGSLIASPTVGPERSVGRPTDAAGQGGQHPTVKDLASPHKGFKVNLDINSKRYDLFE